jgi:endonuclease/exonuclease/phosphatase family metal-dependent hydrolase
LRVATYNVHQFLDANGQYNLASVATVLREQDAGIVGLQETEGARITSGNVHGVRWLAEALGYHYHPGPDTETGGYGVALLSAWPVRDVQVVELPTDGTVTRPAMRATVDHPDGAFPVVVAHLEVGGDVRTRQAARVLELVDGTPRAVVVGDFNATPDEAVVDTMTDQFTDAWAAAGEGDGDTFSAGRPRRRIDYVFVRGFEPTDSVVFGGPGESDHRGVRATLDRA